MLVSCQPASVWGLLRDGAAPPVKGSTAEAVQHQECEVSTLRLREKGPAFLVSAVGCGEENTDGKQSSQVQEVPKHLVLVPGGSGTCSVHSVWA